MVSSACLYLGLVCVWGLAGTGEAGVGVRRGGGLSSGKEHCTEMLFRTSIWLILKR